MARFPASLLLAGLLAGALAATGPAAAADTFLRMVSGPAGGNWYPLGAKLMEIVGTSLEGVVTSNAPGGGGANVQDINRGDVEIGFSYGHTVHRAFTGTDRSGKAHPNLRFVATLYPAALQTAVPADSDIESYADLLDRNISPGKARWSGYEAVELLLSYYGFGVDDVRANGGTVHHVSYSDSVALMRDGHIDAFSGLTSVPQASFIDLNFSVGIRFLPVEADIRTRFLAENPGYVESTIPQAAYEDLAGDVPTVGATTVLVVHRDVPDDVVYGVTRLLWEHRDDFVAVSPTWRQARREDALQAAVIPLHPGAERYYADHGLLP